MFDCPISIILTPSSLQRSSPQVSINKGGEGNLKQKMGHISRKHQKQRSVLCADASFGVFVQKASKSYPFFVPRIQRLVLDLLNGVRRMQERAVVAAGAVHSTSCMASVATPSPAICKPLSHWSSHNLRRSAGQ